MSTARETWAAFLRALLKQCEEWSGRKVPLSRFGDGEVRDGDGPLPPDVVTPTLIVAWCRRELRMVARVLATDALVEGWDFAVGWRAAERRFSICAIDPRGAEHLIPSLAGMEVSA